jgi:DNA-dependent metalloprotease WSS1
MNHSKYFWEVRNAYAEQMRVLFSRGYTGEGMWGRGALLTTGDFERNASLPGQEEMPEHLCGGAYRRQSRRKRKATGPEMSWREKKERRVLKKFGANGVALGGNDAEKAKLEKGRRVAAAPKVASSKRGRDLRANAALARFEQQKTEDAVKESRRETPEVDKDETASGSETESGSDGESGRGTVRIQGRNLVDGMGRAFIKICEDEDLDDQDAAKELAELRGAFGGAGGIMNGRESPSRPITTPAEHESGEAQQLNSSKAASNPRTEVQRGNIKGTRPDTKEASQQADDSSAATRNAAVSPPQANVCGVCSTTNDNMSVTCSLCANVLAPEKVPGSWKCKSAACEGSNFVNAGDAGVCGACGGRKEA